MFIISKHLIYIADDDKKVCHLLKSQLVSENYLVEEFYNGKELLERFLSVPCDLIITDIMMPNMSGYDLCREIRKVSDVPIVMISAKDEEIDRVLGLELGSDDYISKPFSLREITIKVRNMLRRTNKNSSLNTEEKLICKDLEIIKSNRMILIHGEELKTTVKEYDLLKLLIENKNQAFSREMIIEKVWGYDYYGETRQVDHLIKRLRKKMLLADSECKIETIWGYGYKVSD
ncbi:response regulator transcription factor (plasmid) [Haloimpatiens sp. FM7330]|uniref:response regulator transcription factor n=1 Tax=Haloimpatiens sp. FM7330 TaxID=3298610 RepID=UPI00362848A1